MKWISVKDSPPPKGVEVLTFSKLPHGKKKSIETYHGSKYDIGVWNYVTHWQELPEDPSEEPTEYDCLGDSDSEGGTLCGNLRRMHKWKRLNWDKTICMYPGCDARC